MHACYKVRGPKGNSLKGEQQGILKEGEVDGWMDGRTRGLIREEGGRRGRTGKGEIDGRTDRYIDE